MKACPYTQVSPGRKWNMEADTDAHNMVMATVLPVVLSRQAKI